MLYNLQGVFMFVVEIHRSEFFPHNGIFISHNIIRMLSAYLSLLFLIFLCQQNMEGCRIIKLNSIKNYLFEFVIIFVFVVC